MRKEEAAVVWPGEAMYVAKPTPAAIQPKWLLSQEAKQCLRDGHLIMWVHQQPIIQCLT
jgi:hypothetical protein